MPPKRLKTGFSLYCDILRLGAALVVLFGHASHQALSGGFLWWLGHVGHAAVIIFFVLSGFIIAYVSATSETGLAEYSAARLARLYSVVIPAIVLTYLLDTIGQAHNPSLYYAGWENMPVWRAVAALLFLSESGAGELSLYSNSSFWTLPFEFWYYVMFGAAMFLRGPWRVAAVIVSALIAGPRILLLFPVWLSGVAAYHASQRRPVGKWALTFFVGSATLALLGFAARETGAIPSYGDVAYLPFAFSLADYIIGVGVALNLYAASSLAFAFLEPFKDGIRSAAGMTFSLYLFHLPIMFCVAAFMPPHLALPVRFGIMVVSSFLVSALLSRFTESRRDGLRKSLLALFRRSHDPLHRMKS
jgi:peptidoglycan/LPS O-acetylase OafA/YrhL